MLVWRSMMRTSKIVEELVQRPRGEVEEDLGRVRDQKALLESEEQFLMSVLRLQESDKGLAEAKVTSNGAKVLASGAGRTGLLVEAKEERRLTARDHILAVMSPSGYQPWPIPNVIEAVKKRDPDIQDAAIRVALRRMLSGGILMRDSTGSYRLEPTRQTTQGRFSIEAPG